jgi:uncharacterized membrane protein YdjX (TVP38/TMEM64 family)
MRRALPILLVLLVAGLFAAGQQVRGALDLELSADTLPSLRQWIAGLGWKGAALFVALATFRIFLLLPSWLLLTLGGLAFGGVGGAILGTIGTTLSALLCFGISRAAGREFVERRLSTRVRGLEQRLQRAGLSVVAVATGHPAVPMTSFHWAAGLTSLSLAGFAAAVLAGASVRATSLAFVGSAFVDLGLGLSLVILGGLALATGLPLLHRGFRRWLFAGEPGDTAAGRSA